MSRPMSLDGAVAVLTGAGSGIGRATAVALARRGASVVVSDLSEARVGEVVDEITTAGRPVIGLPADVTVEGDLEKLRDAALQRFGRIDVVMNNVGVLAIGAPETLAGRGMDSHHRHQPAQHRAQQPGVSSRVDRPRLRTRGEHRLRLRTAELWV